MSGLAHIADLFEWGGRLPDGRLEQRDLSAHDVLAGVVVELMLADAKLVEIFDESIYRMPYRVTWDIWDSYPMLQVYADTVIEDQRPTNFSGQAIEVFVVVFFDAQLSGEVETITQTDGQGWEPTIGTLVRHIQQILRTALLLDNLVGADLPSAKTVPLARMAEPGAISLFDLAEPDGNRVALVQEVSWLYDVKVNHDTGRMSQIEAAGGL